MWLQHEEIGRTSAAQKVSAQPSFSLGVVKQTNTILPKARATTLRDSSHQRNCIFCNSPGAMPGLPAPSRITGNTQPGTGKEPRVKKNPEGEKRNPSDVGTTWLNTQATV